MIKIEGIIRKISIGADPKNNMNFTVGQSVGKNKEFKVERIDTHEYDSVYHSIKRYDVWVSNSTGVVRVWKSYENMPTTLEYEFV